MYSSETIVRVRYAETDQMGYAYYGNYAAWYEVARVESLRALDLSYKEFEENGVMMPVFENYSKYLLPARYDDELKIITKIKELPGAKIRFNYDIFNSEGKLIHQGETLLGFVKKSNGVPCRPPTEFIEALRPFFSDEG